VSPALSAQPEEARKAQATRTPEKPYLSTQIGCSEIAPMMIALGTWDGMPPRVVDWMQRARERASFGRRSKKIPSHLKSPIFEGPVWCCDAAAKVGTAFGPLPYCIATKAGAYEKDAQEDYQARGHELELTLWHRWVESLRADDVCALDLESLVSQYEVLARYPKKWNVRAPSVRHPVESRLVTYVDGWGFDVVGEEVVVNCKLSRDRKDEPDVPAWIQIQGEIACGRASLGVLVYGEKWNADYIAGPPEERGPVVPFPVEPDANAERAILATVAAAWDAIDSVRAQMATKGRTA